MSLPIKLLLFRFWLSWRSQSLLRWRQRLKCRCAIPAAETDRSCVPRLSAWALFFHCRERTRLCTALMTGINFLTQDHFYPSHLWNMSDRIRTWEGSLQACAIMQGNSFLSGVYFSVMSFRWSLWERLCEDENIITFQFVLQLKVLNCSPVARMKCQHLTLLQTADVFTCFRITCTKCVMSYAHYVFMIQLSCEAVKRMLVELQGTRCKRGVVLLLRKQIVFLVNPWTISSHGDDIECLFFYKTSRHL